MALVPVMVPTSCRSSRLFVEPHTGAVFRDVCARPECCWFCAYLFRRKIVCRAEQLSSAHHLMFLTVTLPYPLCGRRFCRTYGCKVCSQQLNRRSSLARRWLAREGYRSPGTRTSPGSRQLCVQQYGDKHGRLHAHQLLEFSRFTPKNVIRKAFRRYGLRFQGKEAIQRIESSDVGSKAAYAARYAARAGAKGYVWPRHARRWAAWRGSAPKRVVREGEDRWAVYPWRKMLMSTLMDGVPAAYFGRTALDSVPPAGREGWEVKDVLVTSRTRGLEVPRVQDCRALPFGQLSFGFPRPVSGALFLNSLSGRVCGCLSGVGR